MFGLVTKNIEPWDPLYDCPAANKAKQGEINNLASNDVLDMASLDEWDAVCAKDPSAEMVGGKMLIGIMDYEELGQSSLDDANWKARLVCTGNFIRNIPPPLVSIFGGGGVPNWRKNSSSGFGGGGGEWGGGGRN